MKRLTWPFVWASTPSTPTRWSAVLFPFPTASARPFAWPCSARATSRLKPAPPVPTWSALKTLVAQIKGGWLEFDAAVAAPDVMALVGQVGRVLGPRGLMPNAKTGTVTFDVAKAVQELKAGRVDFKVDKAGVLHAPLGKVSFGPEKILGNLKALLDAVVRLKPSAAKGQYMLSMTVSTTMGPGFKVDMAQCKKFIEG